MFSRLINRGVLLFLFVPPVQPLGGTGKSLTTIFPSLFIISVTLPFFPLKLVLLVRFLTIIVLPTANCNPLPSWWFRSNIFAPSTVNICSKTLSPNSTAAYIVSFQKACSVHSVTTVTVNRSTPSSWLWLWSWLWSWSVLQPHSAQDLQTFLSLLQPSAIFLSMRATVKNCSLSQSAALVGGC